jgi:phytoene desaturase
MVRMRDLATVAPWRSLRQLGRAYLHDPRLRMFLDRYATYTGSDPRRAPAALAAVPYAELSFGGWYVRGGLRRLADALLDRCVERGVTVRTGAEVRKITATGSGVDGVLLADGARLPADLVVANADAAHVYTDLIGVPAAARRLRRAPASLSGFVLLLGVRGRTPGLAHHTVLFPSPSSYDREFDAVFGDPARPVADPTLYLSVPDDPVVRPAGHEAWFVLVNAARHGTGKGTVDWRTPGLADWYADRLLERLAARGHDVRGRLVFRAVRTPADLEAETGAVGGAIYGTSSNGAAAAFLRPPNRSAVPGLFLVGGSSHPGGGLPLVTLSAQLVATAIGPA